MEDHFIIRFPEKLKLMVEDDIAKFGHLKGELEVKSDGKIFYKYREKEYGTHVAKLPCIVESYKTFDNKQFFKVCDISTLVVVKDSEDDLDLQMLDNSGLTPPMKYVKIRRFRKKKVIRGATESIEEKVKILLDKDIKAVETTIVYHNDDLEEQEVKNIAEEIESSLLMNKKETKVEITKKIGEDTNNINEEKDSKSPHLDIDSKILELEKSIEIAANPILKKRFIDSLNDLMKRKTDHK